MNELTKHAKAKEDKYKPLYGDHIKVYCVKETSREGVFIVSHVISDDGANELIDILNEEIINAKHEQIHEVLVDKLFETMDNFSIRTDKEKVS